MTEIAYIDESYDDEFFAMSALIVPVAHWRETFEAVKVHRQRLKAVYGIFTSKELHALEFVSGRGRISERMIPKGLRAQLFRETMDMLAALPHVRVISGIWPIGDSGKKEIHAKAFSRIAERLQRRAVESRSHILRMVDEGKDIELRKVARRSAIYNMVGWCMGGWLSSEEHSERPADRRSDLSFIGAFVLPATCRLRCVCAAQIGNGSYTAGPTLQTR